jgi:hypothetical protein
MSPTMSAKRCRKGRVFAVLTLVVIFSVAKISHFSAESEEFRELFDQTANISHFIDATGMSKEKHAANELKDVPVVESRKVPSIIESDLALSPLANFSACLLIKNGLLTTITCSRCDVSLWRRTLSAPNHPVAYSRDGAL